MPVADLVRLVRRAGRGVPGVAAADVRSARAASGPRVSGGSRSRSRRRGPGPLSGARRQRCPVWPSPDHLRRECGRPASHGRSPASRRVAPSRNGQNAAHVLPQLAEDEVGAVAPEVAGPVPSSERRRGLRRGLPRGRTVGRLGVCPYSFSYPSTNSPGGPCSRRAGPAQPVDDRLRDPVAKPEVLRARVKEQGVQQMDLASPLRRDLLRADASSRIRARSLRTASARGRRARRRPPPPPPSGQLSAPSPRTRRAVRVRHPADELRETGQRSVSSSSPIRLSPGMVTATLIAPPRLGARRRDRATRPRAASPARPPPLDVQHEVAAFRRLPYPRATSPWMSSSSQRRHHRRPSQQRRGQPGSVGLARRRVPGASPSRIARVVVDVARRSAA